MLLQNKTAVVTGCNKGIGKKILEIFFLPTVQQFLLVLEVLLRNLKLT